MAAAHLSHSVIACDYDGNVRLIDLESGIVVRSVRCNFPTSLVALSHDNLLCAISTGNSESEAYSEGYTVILDAHSMRCIG